MFVEFLAKGLTMFRINFRFMIAFLLLVPGIARAEDTIAKQAIMLDYDTGTVLLEKNADDRMTPSSMSKEMTMYMVFEALKEGKITLDQTLPVSERAWRMQKAAAGASVMFVKLGSQVRVEDLVRGVIIQSGNDAAITLAEGLGGTEDNFALMMNK